MDDEPSSNDPVNGYPQDPNKNIINTPVIGLQKKKNHLKPVVIWLLVLVIIVGAAFFGWNYYSNRTDKVVKTPAHHAVTVTVKPADYTYLATPVPLGNLNFFQNLGNLFGTSCSGTQTTNCPPKVTAAEISYYQVGLTLTKQPIVVAADYNNGANSFFYVAIENTTGHYEIIGKLNNSLNPGVTADKNYIWILENSINSNVSFNSVENIPGFDFAATTTIDNSPFSLYDHTGPAGYFIDGLAGIRGSTYVSKPVSPTDITKLSQSKTNTYYSVLAEDNANYQVKEIYGTVGGVYAASYLPIDPLTGLKAPPIIWDADNSTNTFTYTSSAQSCVSTSGYVIAKGITADQLTKVGVGPNAQTIYELPSSGALFSEYYTNFYAGGPGLASNLQKLTTSQYQSDHALIVAKNVFGEYVVYQRDDMVESGACS
jgi:hypothetical protein